MVTLNLRLTMTSIIKWIINYAKNGHGQGYMTISLNFGTVSLTLEQLNELRKKYIKILSANS